jgi:hypothetical protein
MDQNGGAGAIVISDGTPLAYQLQVDPSCTVSTAPTMGGRSVQSGATSYGYGN